MIAEGPVAADAFKDRVFDVCVVGSGAAGISIAKEMDGSRLSVAVLEAGGLDVSPESQDLYKGEEDTRRMPADYLSAYRLRAFGGTTGHWAGEGRPLDEIDFEKRDWIPHSGWPIARRDLESYYHRAAPYCRLPGIRPEDSTPPSGPAAEGEERFFSFRPLYRASRVPRFGTEHLDALRASKNVEVFLGCPVVRISSRAGGRDVATVTISSGGKEHDVKARTFVLAAGTIESARLLLASARRRTLRLGREEDVVGRYFMDHSEGTCAVLRLPGGQLQELSGLLNSFDARVQAPYAPTLWVSPRIQALEGLPNAAFELSRLSPSQQPEQLDGIGRISDFFRGDAGPQGASFELSIRGETRPDSENRVTLTESLDSLGLPRVKLFYRWHPEDLEGFERALQLLAQDFGWRHGAVLRQVAALGDAVGSSFHQMGTTRMGQSPVDSVVDRNCRVHSVPNLYVAGSSVFATCGWANPTLSLVALSIRLADRLKEAA